MRFLNPGPSGVLKALLDGRETLPTELQKEIQGSMEARALRPWEYFHERIIPWSGVCSDGAAAGVFSGFSIAGTLGTLPPGALVVITRIQNQSGQSLSVRLNITPASTTTGLFPFPLDSRWGSNQIVFPSLNQREAALSGSELLRITTTAWEDWFYVMQLDQLSTVPIPISVMGTTLNTAVLVNVMGFVVLYRIRGQ